MLLATLALSGCRGAGTPGSGSGPDGAVTTAAPEAPAIVETIDGVGLAPVAVEGFDRLSASERALAYYLVRAAIAGRDLGVSRDGGVLLEIRDLLEEILTHPRALDSRVREALKHYLERFWIHGGNHDRFSGRKFVPSMTAGDLRGAAIAAQQEGASIRLAIGESLDAKLGRLAPVIFDPAFEPAPARSVPAAGGAPAARRSETTRHREATLRTVRGFLAKAAAFAPAGERGLIERMAAAHGDAAALIPNGPDDWIEEWLSGGRTVDLLAGFDRSGNDGATWYGLVSMIDAARDAPLRALAAEAPAMVAEALGRSPTMPPGPVVRASAVTLLATVAPEGPAIGEAITFPAGAARRRSGTRSLILANVGAAVDRAIGRAIVREFAPASERDRLATLAPAARHAFVALREVLGAAAEAGDPVPAAGATDEWRAVLAAARADLLALRMATDPRPARLGLVSSAGEGEAILPIYLAWALADLRGAAADGRLEGTDRRASLLVLMELASGGGVVRERRDGMTGFRIADRATVGARVSALLARVEAALASPGREHSSGAIGDGARGVAGDGARGIAGDGPEWVARFGTRAEADLAAEITGRAARTVIPSRLACLMPDLIPLRDAGGNVIDARLSPAADFTVQMLRYSGKLPYEAPR